MGNNQTLGNKCYVGKTWEKLRVNTLEFYVSRCHLTRTADYNELDISFPKSIPNCFKHTIFFTIRPTLVTWIGFLGSGVREGEGNVSTLYETVRNYGEGKAINPRLPGNPIQTWIGT